MKWHYDIEFGLSDPQILQMCLRKEGKHESRGAPNLYGCHHIPTKLPQSMGIWRTGKCGLTDPEFWQLAFSIYRK
jgi:hypothetical protein